MPRQFLAAVVAAQQICPGLVEQKAAQACGYCSGLLERQTLMLQQHLGSVQKGCLALLRGGDPPT